nr:hypothetical protein [uncultured bacterium]
MIEFRLKLLEMANLWRKTAQSTRGTAPEIPDLLARGHMHGLSDGLDLAADDIDKFLDEQVPPSE